MVGLGFAILWVLTILVWIVAGFFQAVRFLFQEVGWWAPLVAAGSALTIGFVLGTIF